MAHKQYLTHKQKRRWSLIILLVGLPLYVIAAVGIMSRFDPLDRPAWWIELAIYLGLGVLWALPFRAVFRGVGQADPDSPAD